MSQWVSESVSDKVTYWAARWQLKIIVGKSTKRDEHSLGGKTKTTSETLSVQKQPQNATNSIDSTLVKNATYTNIVATNTDQKQRML